MSLRDIVAGSDSCTVGAGPSNAMGTLVNSLLGGPSKAQEHMRELPSFRPPALAMGPGFHDPTALALSGGSSLQIPGMGPSRMAIPEAEAIFQGVVGQNAEWDSIFNTAPAQMGPLAGPPGVIPALHMPKDEATMAIDSRIKGFFEHGRATHVTGAPLMLPAIAPELASKLSAADKIRIRNRATILSRQMHSEKGDQYADAQVNSLLASLGVQHTDAALLSAGAMPHVHDAQWHDVWASEQQKTAAAAAAQQNASWNQLWNDKAALAATMVPRPLPAMASGWVDEFAAKNTMAAPGETWASEFAQDAIDGGSVATEEGPNAATSAATRATTAAMVDAMQRTGDPKLQNSKFMQFMQAMSRGDVELGSNKVIERSEAAINANADAWASEFEQLNLNHQLPSDQGSLGRMMGGGEGLWAEEFASGVSEMGVGSGAMSEMESAWRDLANADVQEAAGGEPDWVREFKEAGAVGSNEVDFDELDRTHGHVGLGVESSSSLSDQYVFPTHNPFTGDADAMEKGYELFGRGVLSEAALAFESVVQANPQDAKAWRLLGIVHAENEDDAQAIAALEKALAIDGSDREAILALAVCYTNEHRAFEAVGVMRRLLAVHPREELRQMETDHGFAPESSQRQSHVLRLFERAAEVVSGTAYGSAQADADADIFIALGVLQHLQGSPEGYARAIGSFEQALNLQPNQYSLWNKLGATLANDKRPHEAIQAYQRALDLKANYMRAWNNLGIAHGLKGGHLEGAKYYVQALGLNPSASNTWGLLLESCQMANRPDLVKAVNDRDLAFLQQQLPL